MPEQERRRGRREEERDRYDERGQRSTGSGYWTNEPGFQEARRHSEEGDPQRAHSYDDDDIRRYRRDAVDQGDRIRDTRGPRDDERDSFENDEFYANRGWTRSAAVESERDWSFYNNQDYSREGRLEINFDRDDADRSNRQPGDFGRGIDAMRGKDSSRERGYPAYDAGRDARDARERYPRGVREESFRRREEEWERQGSGQPQDWEKPGPFTGKGPQGYHRSDERITEEVCERLTRHSQVDATDIEVLVEKGEVTLRGRVADRRQKRLAEDIAAEVSGVQDVQNQIRVQPAGGTDQH